MFIFKTKKQLRSEAPSMSTDSDKGIDIITKYYMEHISTWVDYENKRGATKFYIDLNDFIAMKQTAFNKTMVKELREWSVVATEFKTILEHYTDWDIALLHYEEYGNFTIKLKIEW